MFSVEFVIPTEGADNYDKTLLVDITDSYRTIKVTIFRPAPNVSSEAHGKLYNMLLGYFQFQSLNLLF